MDEKYEGTWHNRDGAITIKYNFTPSILYDMCSILILPIWKIISKYASQIDEMIFEVVDSGDPYNDKSDYYCNWYGKYTCGSCWCRGCSVWLTPRSGYIFNNIPNYHYEDSDEYIANMKSIIGKQFGQHRRDFKKNPERYNTSSLCFREGSPKEVVKIISQDTSRDTSRKYLFNLIDPDYDRRIVALNILEVYRIRGRFDEIKTKIYISQDGQSVDDAEIAIIYELDEICEELRWVQDIGETNHDIRFEWI